MHPNVNPNVNPNVKPKSPKFSSIFLVVFAVLLGGLDDAVLRLQRGDPGDVRALLRRPVHALRV